MRRATQCNHQWLNFEVFAFLYIEIIFEFQEIGDVENWARTIESDMVAINEALNQAYKKGCDNPSTSSWFDEEYSHNIIITSILSLKIKNYFDWNLILMQFCKNDIVRMNQLDFNKEDEHLLDWFTKFKDFKLLLWGQGNPITSHRLVFISSENWLTIFEALT